MENTDELQFDRAEPTESAPPAGTCAVCGQPLRDSYYEVNGRVVCASCSAQFEHQAASGSVAAAVILGIGAALLGAGLYFAIELLTGYEFGLVAIVVGLLVGSAVRKGARGRAGWRFQLIAVGLTYLSVVATDTSMIVREVARQARARSDSEPTLAVDSGATRPTAAVEQGDTVGMLSADVAPGHASPAMALVVLIGLVFAAPILIGWSSPLHLLITGIALYEAWKLNRAPALKMSGPHRLASGV